MAKCRQCNVDITDEAHLCPLCHCVLEQSEETHNTYPDVRLKTRRLMFLGRVYLFVAILVSVIVGVMNYEYYHGVWWCSIIIASLFYLYLVLRFAVLDDAGYRVKMVVLMICAVLMVIFIDVVMGYRGWSLNYVIPGGILLANVAIGVLMIVNRRNWQSYLLFQIVVMLWSALPLLLWKLDIVTRPFISLIAFGVSVALFLGTLIIGDRRSRIELKRRFHVR